MQYNSQYHHKEGFLFVCFLFLEEQQEIFLEPAFKDHH